MKITFVNHSTSRISQKFAEQVVTFAVKEILKSKTLQKRYQKIWVRRFKNEMAKSKLTRHEGPIRFIGRLQKNAFEKYIKRSFDLIQKSGVTLVFVGPSEMKKINRKYRFKSYVTDVLSFGVSAEEAFAYFNANENLEQIGEIVVCPEKVRANAISDGRAFKDEFLEILVHGILHLFGDDHTDEVRFEEQMFVSQRAIVRKIKRDMDPKNA